MFRCADSPVSGRPHLGSSNNLCPHLSVAGLAFVVLVGGDELIGQVVVAVLLVFLLCRATEPWSAQRSGYTPSHAASVSPMCAADCSSALTFCALVDSTMRLPGKVDPAPMSRRRLLLGMSCVCQHVGLLANLPRSHEQTHGPGHVSSPECAARTRGVLEQVLSIRRLR